MIRSVLITLLTIVSVAPYAAAQSLAQRIADAAPGDTIVVASGVYTEGTLLIDKPLTLLGKGNPVLDGQEKNELINIIADSVRVEGFIFRNVAKTFMSDRSAVRVDQAGHCTISGNQFDDTFFGVYLAGAYDCTISDNTFSATSTREVDGGNGIHSWYSRRLDIHGNHIRGHRDGIYLEFTEDSHVTDNTSIGNRRYGLHFMFSDRCAYENNRFEDNRAGVAVMYGDAVTMRDNTFRGAWGPSAYGLLLKEIKDGVVERNLFEDNSAALLIESTDRMSFYGNRFVNNGWALQLMASAVNNRFERNTFVGNTFDVSTNSRRTTTTFQENYWDRYNGYDLDHDGHGDVPFRPVSLFSLVVEQNEAALFLLRSPLVDVLNAAEKVLPVLTPAQLQDTNPLMAPPTASPTS